ncbi:MAG: HAD-IA family hydrolase [Bacteroidota bacterium]
MPIKKVIFDCDGVLVDSEIVAAEVVTQELSQLGTVISIQDYLTNYTGKTFRNILEYLKVDLHCSINEFIQNAEHKVYENIRPIKGIHEVLDSIKLEKSVVSNSYLKQVKKSVEAIGIEHHFSDRYFSSSMVAKPKPSPMIYELAAQTLNVSPYDCLVIEDSKTGVTAAKSANMNVIGFCGGSHILNGHDKALTSLGAESVAMNTTELAEIIADRILD